MSLLMRLGLLPCLFLTFLLPCPRRSPPYGAAPHTDWPNIGAGKGGMRYSPLDQINRDNVRNLQVAWTYHTGDADAAGNSTIECTPIVVEGVMYVSTVRNSVVALDAATGRLLWDYKLDAGGYATPCTYAVHGRQYVAIAAGGGGKLTTPAGDEFAAFALPMGSQKP